MSSVPVSSSAEASKAPSAACSVPNVDVIQEGASIEKRAALMCWEGSLSAPLPALRVSSAVAVKVMGDPGSAQVGAAVAFVTSGPAANW